MKPLNGKPTWTASVKLVNDMIAKQNTTVCGRIRAYKAGDQKDDIERIWITVMQGYFLIAPSFWKDIEEQTGFRDSWITREDEKMKGFKIMLVRDRR